MVLAVVLVLSLAAGGYLFALARSWSEHAGALESEARGLGTELAESRAEVAASSNALQSVQDQLDDAQQRIVELADTVAQTGDDREAQREIARYQREISEAAAGVAGALDDCIDGQRQLIDYLETQASAPPPDDDDETPSPSPTPEHDDDGEELERFRTEVDEFCRGAVDANDDLQQRLVQP